MHDFDNLKRILYSELEEYKKKGKLTGGDLEAVHKMTGILKNLCKIEMAEGGSSYEGGMSGRHYVRGHYSRDGGSYGESYGDSYGRGGSYGDSYGESYRGYSRDGAIDHMMRQIEEAMQQADNPKERAALQRCMAMLQNT